jgi:hypothetical protein
MAEILETNEKCPVDELGAYLDGELAAERRGEVELHVSACTSCNRDLNFQKKMLLVLEGPIDGEFELPEDFTKRIVTAAESRVDGLRRPKERRNALLICSALGLFSLFALGADTGRAFGVVGSTVEIAGAVIGTVGHFVLDIGLAATVILKTLVLITFAGSAAPTVVGAALIVGAVLVFSRILLRQRRA